jgi:hypothetical protein
MDTIVVVKIAGYWRVTLNGAVDSSHRYKRDADKAARRLRVYGWSERKIS